MKIRETSYFIALIALVIISNPTLTLGELVIDQRWERPQSEYDWASYSIANNQPLGQEFTPAMDNIVAVELSIRDCASEPSGLASIIVELRNSTITGTILSSATTTLENPLFEWWFFDFEQQVTLIPKNLYVLDIFIDGSPYWTWNSWEDSDGIGLPGRLIRSGQFIPGDSKYAFGFRTYAIPEPATLLMLGLGGLALLRKRKA